VSVVGFDDVPEARFFVPALTTVRQDFDEVGRRALRLLLGRMAADAGNGHLAGEEHVVVTPRLIVRESTAAPAAPEAP